MAFLVFLAACAAAALPGIVVRPGAWYRTLAKPPWRPPDWLFGPVWLVLYISIAVAGWLVWRRAGLDAGGIALGIYAVQLVFNALWSIVFFGMKRPDLALVEIVFLWASIVATIVAFYQIDALAGLILLPYLVWVSFAAVLNFRIWQLNRPSAA